MVLKYIKKIIFYNKKAIGKHFTAGFNLNSFENSKRYLQDRIVIPLKIFFFFSIKQFFFHLQMMYEYHKLLANVIKDFVQCFIDCPKPIICGVKGGSIGIGTTIMGLCDFVYSTEDAFFRSPLIKIAFGPEGGSSVTFPQIFGRQKAFEILVLGRNYYAKDLQDSLVLKVFKSELEMNQNIDELITQLLELDWESLLAAKILCNAQ